ncbi:MAG: hypothetical protein DRI65_12840 [Chloroflexota bacterium]|nr:MAG: hypothetical protein DRI65_12840 [Chloroflexota bacterium]
MNKNQQAASAGEEANAIIEQLANPGQAIETETSTVEVLDQAQPVDDWEKRFKGYKASTDKTLHKLRQQSSQFDLMSNENNQLKKRLEETQAQIPKTPNEMLELFSEEEVAGMEKMFGGKVSGLQDEVSRLTEELNYTRNERVQNEALHEHQSVVEAVANAVPNYADIDVDPGFSTYMKGIDEFNNVRYDLLVKAKNETPPDIGRIVSFYVDYSNTKQAEAQQPQQYTQQELLQQPKGSHTGGVVPQQNLGIQWNTATSSQFYKDKALGKYTPEQAEALELDLFRSMKHK